MGSMEAARVKKAYFKLLLAFEQQLSQDCKVEVRKVCTASPMSVMCAVLMCTEAMHCLTGPIFPRHGFSQIAYG